MKSGRTGVYCTYPLKREKEVSAMNIRFTGSSIILAAAIFFGNSVFAEKTGSEKSKTDSTSGYPGMMMHGPGGMYGHMGMHGPGMMGPMGYRGRMGMRGYHMPGMMVWNPAIMSGLNKTQRDKVWAIMKDLRNQHWSTRRKIMEEQAGLFSLYNKPQVDIKKVSAVYQRIFKLRREMLESSLHARNRLNKVIPAKLRTGQWQRRYYGPGRNMHRRMHRHMMQ